jgi:quercetin dioxygenase-like cupin family protein
MLVFRWQAPVVPDKKQIRALFEAEGLVPTEEVFPPETFVDWHRHRFDEVRTVVEGEVLFDIAGNKLLLRSGDRIVIPSNTKHNFRIQGTSPCVCIVANKLV